MHKPWIIGGTALAGAAQCLATSTPHLDTRATVSPIVVSPSEYFDGDDGPWSSFFLRVGTPEQDVRVLVSTASSMTMVVMAEYGCSKDIVDPVPSNCASARGALFSQNSSSTWDNIGNYAINGDGVGLGASLGYQQNADFGLEKVGLGLVNGTNGPILDSQVVGGIPTVSPFYLGIFGLSPQPANFSLIGNSTPSYFTNLWSEGLIPSLSWSYTAGAQYQLKDGVYGQLIFGGKDTSRFQSNSVSFTLASDISRDIVVAIQSISYSGGSQMTLLSDPVYAFIDSTDPNIWLPQTACQKFEDAFGLTLDNDTGLYLVNDTHHSTLLATDAEVTFLLSDSLDGGATVSIVLPYTAFARTVEYPKVENSSYYFPLKQAANDTQYTLGRTFLQEAYLTVDYNRRNFSVSQCTWVDGATENVITITAPSNTTETSGTNSTSSTNDSTSTKAGNTLSSGTVAGIAVAAVAVTALIAIISWILLKKRRRNSSTHKALPPHDDLADCKYEQFDMSGEKGDGGADDSMNKAHFDEPQIHQLDAVASPLPEMRGGEIFELEARMPELDASNVSSHVKELEGEIEHNLLMMSAPLQPSRTPSSRPVSPPLSTGKVSRTSISRNGSSAS